MPLGKNIVNVNADINERDTLRERQRLHTHARSCLETQVLRPRAGCTAVTRGSWQKKGVKDPGTSVEEKRGACSTRGGRDLDGVGPSSRGRTRRRWFFPRDHSRSLRNPTKKGVARLALLVPGALRDFWISASLVTREPKTVGQVASRRNESERANGERGEGTRRVPFQSERTLWGGVQPLNGERSLRLRQGKKKLCERWHLARSLPPPLFYSPPSARLFSFLPPATPTSSRMMEPRRYLTTRKYQLYFL